ncbi:MAG: hypothetical protein DYG99_05695 [Bacteroidetes bacterium CHB5]|nr:hypothetical protein [Bacteroidetes bacterium CHB5]
MKSKEHLKLELVEMIERETNIQVLEALHILLSKSTSQPVLKEKLSSRALKAEEDIKRGRYYSVNEVISRTTKS